MSNHVCVNKCAYFFSDSELKRNKTMLLINLFFKFEHFLPIDYWIGLVAMATLILSYIYFKLSNVNQISFIINSRYSKVTMTFACISFFVTKKQNESKACALMIITNDWSQHQIVSYNLFKSKALGSAITGL